MRRQERRIAAGFFDVKMPGGIDGIETIRRVRQIDESILCTMVTAYQDRSIDDINRLFFPDHQDEWDYVAKPFTQTEVRQRARSLVSSWNRRRLQEEYSGKLETLNRTLDIRVVERTARLEKEMKARLRMELDMRQAQKLESVGRLAAGIAHEINTPVQFVSDSVHFLRDAMRDLTSVVEKLQAVSALVLQGAPARQAAQAAERAQEAADVAYLFENVPKALDRSLDGLTRVAGIVRSMAEFAYRDRDPGHMIPFDLNRAVQSTLTVAGAEYKGVADLELDLGTLPPCTCLPGDVNQVMLNIVVNAAYAMRETVKDTGTQGRLTVRTRCEGDFAVISIADTGMGIPQEIRDRIFDPFFTTKEVGKGTGQGLAIAHTIVVEKHGGKLYFETQPGKGTTFFVCLPLAVAEAGTLHEKRRLPVCNRSVRGSAWNIRFLHKEIMPGRPVDLSAGMEVL